MRRECVMSVKKNIKTIGFIILIFLSFNAIFWILPDLILFFRNWIKSLNPNSPLFNNNINDLTYLSIILNPLFSFTAITISILAVIINKSSNKMKSNEYETQIITSATYIYLSIEHSSSAIYDLYKKVANPDTVILDRISYQEASYLYVNKAITLDEFKYCRDYLYDVSFIISSQKKAGAEKKLEEFYIKYFKSNSIDKNDKLDNLIKKMQEIIERK